jgi:K+-transporting ATPase c subunit
MFPPPTPTAGETWNSTPLQVTVDKVTNSGVGLSDTTTVNAAPVQLPDKVRGVTL